MPSGNTDKALNQKLQFCLGFPSCEWESWPCCAHYRTVMGKCSIL